MTNLEKYTRKISPKIECIQTSVFIETKQKQFIDVNNLNLSSMVRDFLESIIKQSKGNK